jgi:predicted metal-dependent hydrolase
MPESALPPAEALALAQSLLDSGRAFAAHEVLEARWKASPAAERDLWQGLAQLCVGITHAQRGNGAGATRLLERGVERLRRYADDPPYGVDVAGLVDWFAAHGDAPADVEAPRLTRAR